MTATEHKSPRPVEAVEYRQGVAIAQLARDGQDHEEREVHAKRAEREAATDRHPDVRTVRRGRGFQVGIDPAQQRSRHERGYQGHQHHHGE